MAPIYLGTNDTFRRCSSDDSRERKHDETLREKDEIKIQEDAGDLEWMQVLDVRMCDRQWYITVLAMLGLFLAVLIRELCIDQDDTEFEGNTNCGKKIKVVLYMKGICSALTAIQVYLMLKQMELKTEYNDTQKSLRSRSRGLQLKIYERPSFFQRKLRFLRLHGRLIFFLLPLNMVHPVPGLSFIVDVEQLGYDTGYRVESLILSVMLVRVYHLFSLGKLRLLATILSLESTLIIRNHSTIRQLNDPRMSKPQLAFKIALEKFPAYIIPILWITILTTATCAVRMYEMNTSKRSSIYVWDQMWMITVMSFTYGDLVPKTHLGRMVCAFSMLCGAMLMGLMTATLIRNIALNERELRLMKTIDKDKMEATCLINSVRIIQSWVRGRLRAFECMRSGGNSAMCMLTEHNDAERRKRKALLYELVDTRELLRRGRDPNNSMDSCKTETRGNMDVREDEWRGNLMRCVEQLAAQVQSLQQNASIQNTSMARIEEALASLADAGGGTHLASATAKATASPRASAMRQSVSLQDISTLPRAHLPASSFTKAQGAVGAGGGHAMRGMRRSASQQETKLEEMKYSPASPTTPPSPVPANKSGPTRWTKLQEQQQQLRQQQQQQLRQQPQQGAAEYRRCAHLSLPAQVVGQLGAREAGSSEDYIHSESEEVEQRRHATRSLMSTAARGGKNEERRAQSQGLRSAFHFKAGADVCSRMLTYAGVCWRMLTYADVC